MPELPEVQTTVDDLNKRIIGLKVKGIWVNQKKDIRQPRLFNKLKKDIIGKKFLKGYRRAKYLVFPMSEGKTLLIHQKMSGHLLYGEWKEEKKDHWMGVSSKEIKKDPKNRFIRLIFFLSNGKMLALSDLRRFAKVLLINSKDLDNLKEIKTLGPEPLEKSFVLNKFREIISKKKGRIKTVLMDPTFVAGIGNIYSDEILWNVGVHPLRDTSDLKDDEIKKIHKYIKSVLKKGVQLRGTSIDDYRDTYGKKGRFQEVLKAYHKTGTKCTKKDGGTIERVKVGGRSAHFCPIHQK